MSSEMREIKAMADAVEYGIALGKLDAPAVFTKMRDLLNLALLARTEAGADRPVAEISELSGAKLIVLYSADEIGHLPKETKLYTHPQDASGDAAKLGAFVASILNLNEDWIGDVDGGTLQDAAEKCGLLQAVEVSEPCGEGCNCAGYGDFPQTCYRPTDTMKRAMQAKEAAE